MSKPSPPPEARLIRLARDARGLRIPGLVWRVNDMWVRRGGDRTISESRWKQIERGYQSRPAGPDPTFADAGLLGAMAWAVQLDPQQLEKIGKADAAEAERDIIRFEARDQQPPRDEIPGPFRRLAARDHADPEAMWAMGSVQRVWALTALTEGERWGIIMSLMDDLDDPPAVQDRTRRRALSAATSGRSHRSSAAPARPPAVPRQRRFPQARPAPRAVAAAAR